MAANARPRPLARLLTLPPRWLLLPAVATLPFALVSEYRSFVLAMAVTHFIVVAGLNLLTGNLGVASLGHGSLMGIGAYTSAILSVDHGWPFWAAALAAMLAGTLAGLALGLPAFRVSTWYFALITLAFAQVVRALITELSWLTHGFSGVVGIPPPSVAGVALDDRGLLLLALAGAVGASVLIRNLVRSRVGRAMVAVREGALSATASGVEPGRILLMGFGVSGALAGLGGSLFSVGKGVITPDDFGIGVGIMLLLVVILGGAGTTAGPVVGALAFLILPELLEAFEQYRQIVFGLMLLALMMFAPHGLAGWFAGLRARAMAARASDAGAAPPAAAETLAPATAALSPAAANGKSGDAAPAAPLPADRDAALPVLVEDVVKSFGGVRALQGVSLRVDAGDVHAIVGPNGSGKTTLLNIVSALYRPDSGGVRIGELDPTRMRPAQLARAGVGRTFQQPRLLPELSVLDNVLLGAYSTERTSALEIALRAPRWRKESARLAAQATTYLRDVGVTTPVTAPASALPQGQQRLVEIARALFLRPRLLLMDEPAAGLALHELDALAKAVTDVAARGCTVLLIEHDLDFIRLVARTVTVFGEGTVLAAGPAAEVFDNEAVRQAYLGIGGAP